SLDVISAFPFENYMQDIKRKVRRRNNPLAQIGRRLGEIMLLESDDPLAQVQERHFPRFFYRHNAGPVLSGCTRQYRVVALPHFKLTNKSPDNCCGTTAGNIVIVENIAFSDDLQVFVVIGREFLQKDDFYIIPCNSRRVGVYKVNKLSALKM
ncbi:hypothetical protein ALC60_00069, partial [Trachymyrmex zeteki]